MIQLIFDTLATAALVAPAAVGFDAERLSALRIVLIGVLLILAIRFRPQGLIAEQPLRHTPPGAQP